MRVIRASEIGNYLYCNRSWWYENQGIESGNLDEMVGGDEYHHKHGLQVNAARVFRFGGILLILAALISFLAEYF